MLLKASDFIVHDLSAESVFEGCANDNHDGDGDGHDQGTCGGGRACGAAGAYKLELVLRKWFAIDPSREMRAFVRDGVLIGALRSLFPSVRPFVRTSVCLTPSLSLRNGTGISQRDASYYEFLNEPGTQGKIVSSVVACWTAHVEPKWTGPASCKRSFPAPLFYQRE